MSDLPVPINTAKAFRRAGHDCRNFGLLFERFVGYGPDWSLDGTQKRDEAKHLVEAGNAWKRDSNYKKLFDSLATRWKAIIESAHGISFSATLDGRMVIGLGRDSAFETGLTVHRVYGFPYIPGSAVKGIVRAAAVQRLAQIWGVPIFGNKSAYAKKGENSTKVKSPVRLLEGVLDALIGKEGEKDRLKLLDKALQELKGVLKKISPENLPLLKMEAKDFEEKENSLAKEFSNFRTIFGSMSNAGGVTFFDALPVAPPTLTLDVMNPHYPEYYQNENPLPPADWQSPVPIYFIVVEQGSQFLFGVTPRKKPKNSADDEKAQKLVDEAKDWLRIALQEIGVGGKTTSGYGYWKL